ncbi:MAG: LD-carboxypeptidase [Deltaproteobacteria bacterium]|nr:LD-carboxypeptidase [Deltaproteobacteria bacterium]
MVQPLKEGDLIGIAAPSSPFDKQLFKQGVTLLQKMGFEVWYREDIFSQERYLAGSDKRRAQELTELFTKKEVKAILFARGGYGSQRVIPHLDPILLKKNKKPVVGFSDITALLTFLRQDCQTPTLYGPVLTQLGGSFVDRTCRSLKYNLTEKKSLEPFDLSECKIVEEGIAKGKLVGGCLSLITSSMGTPYELNTENSILFFEDTGEKVYALDRMLTQLKNAGKLKTVKGIIIGSLEPKEEEVHSIDTMIKDLLADFDGPIISHFPSGHTKDFVTLPFGVEVAIETETLKLYFEESAFT